mmetsp:Transcript_48426/g.103548  ORF Transcript_48426/g.103548 Transcript_48426/m.103548 type:complete len:663 (+) Transcript_48426:30-2018(+)
MVVLENCNVAIDEFNVGTGFFVYFLTHAHRDHMVGLSSQWKRGVIYCTAVTRALVLRRYPGLRQWVRDLPLDEPVEIGLTSNDSVRGVVVLYDAQHCPGSALVYLDASFGRVLHCGDCRLPIHKVPLKLWSILERVEVCYVDNTFAAPEFEFPGTEEAVSIVVAAIGSGVTVLGITGDLGKEELVTAALAFLPDLEVWVSPWRLANLQAMKNSHQRIAVEPEDAFTVAASRRTPLLWVLSTRRAAKVARGLAFCAKGREASAVRDGRTTHDGKSEPALQCVSLILATGWVRRYAKAKAENLTVTWVPYSLHSSFSELVQFCCGLPSNCRVVCTVPVPSGSSQEHGRMACRYDGEAGLAALMDAADLGSLTYSVQRSHQARCRPRARRSRRGLQLSNTTKAASGMSTGDVRLQPSTEDVDAGSACCSGDTDTMGVRHPTPHSVQMPCLPTCSVQLESLPMTHESLFEGLAQHENPLRQPRFSRESSELSVAATAKASTDGNKCNSHGETSPHFSAGIGNFDGDPKLDIFHLPHKNESPGFVPGVFQIDRNLPSGQNDDNSRRMSSSTAAPRADTSWAEAPGCASAQCAVGAAMECKNGFRLDSSRAELHFELCSLVSVLPDDMAAWSIGGEHLAASDDLVEDEQDHLRQAIQGEVSVVTQQRK